MQVPNLLWINDLLLKHSNIFSKEDKTNKISIFIGTTASIIEALERGVEVIHICNDPVLQSYSSDLWPSIKVSEVDDNTFKYELLKKGDLIKFGDGDKFFEKLYQIIIILNNFSKFIHLKIF